MTEHSKSELGARLRGTASTGGPAQRGLLTVLAGLVALGTLATSGRATAADPGLFYVAGSVGPARVDYDASTFAVGSSSTGYEIAVGTKPLPVLGGELAYVGFPRAFAGINYADTYGVNLSALAFAPLPFVQLYGKIGAMQWHTSAHSPLLSFSRNGTGLSYGAGVGTSWGNLGARVQFERFDVDHARNMQLTSIGLTWAL